MGLSCSTVSISPVSFSKLRTSTLLRCCVKVTVEPAREIVRACCPDASLIAAKERHSASLHLSVIQLSSGSTLLSADMRIRRRTAGSSNRMTVSPRRLQSACLPVGSHEKRPACQGEQERLSKQMRRRPDTSVSAPAHAQADRHPYRASYRGTACLPWRRRVLRWQQVLTSAGAN